MTRSRENDRVVMTRREQEALAQRLADSANTGMRAILRRLLPPSMWPEWERRYASMTAAEVMGEDGDHDTSGTRIPSGPT